MRQQFALFRGVRHAVRNQRLELPCRVILSVPSAGFATVVVAYGVRSHGRLEFHLFLWTDGFWEHHVLLIGAWVDRHENGVIL